MAVHVTGGIVISGRTVISSGDGGGGSSFAIFAEEGSTTGQLIISGDEIEIQAGASSGATGYQARCQKAINVGDKVSVQFTNLTNTNSFVRNIGFVSSDVALSLTQGTVTNISGWDECIMLDVSGGGQPIKGTSAARGDNVNLSGSVNAAVTPGNSYRWDIDRQADLLSLFTTFQAASDVDISGFVKPLIPFIVVNSPDSSGNGINTVEGGVERAFANTQPAGFIEYDNL